MTLTPFSRSHKGLYCWKMACLHPISWRNKWIFTKLSELYWCDMKKNWLDFGDLDPIFKVTVGLRLLEIGIPAPCLQNELMDFGQTCAAILLRQGQELIRFWWPWPHIQGHRRLRLLENGFSAPYLQNKMMNCIPILSRQGQELIRFEWPWPHFQGYTTV